MKYLICGDIHGHYETMETLLEYADKNDYTCVFVGDYVDSFTRTKKDGLRCLVNVKENQHRHIFMRGNHELSYQFPKWKCSGWSKSKQNMYRPIINSIDWYNYTRIDDYLITHAGLSRNFYNKRKEEYETPIEFIQRESTNIESDIYKAGHISGGTIDIGGIYWLRPQYMAPLEEYKQIFGHTQCKSIVHNTKKGYYLIDDLYTKGGQKEVLLYDDKEHVMEILKEEHWND